MMRFLFVRLKCISFEGEEFVEILHLNDFLFEEMFECFLLGDRVEEHVVCLEGGLRFAVLDLFIEGVDGEEVFIEILNGQERVDEGDDELHDGRPVHCIEEMQREGEVS